MPGDQKAPAAIERVTEKEKKAEQESNIQQLLNEIKSFIRQEQGSDTDSPEWKEFEDALTGFLRGNVSGNAATLSIKLYNNIQTYSRGKKNFLMSAKGQAVAQKALEEMKKVKGAAEDPEAAPLMTFLQGIVDKGAKKTNSKKKAEDDWEIIESPKGRAPILITEEIEKKEKDEAAEALREFHKKHGLADPETIRKAQKNTIKDDTDKKALEEFDEKLKQAKSEGALPCK